GVFFASWRRTSLVDGFAIVLLIGAAFLYGEWRLGQETIRPGPGVAMLQGNIDQRIRNQAADSEKARGSIVKHYTDLCMRSLQVPDVELLIWPETSYPLTWCEVSPDWKPARMQDFEYWRELEVSGRAGLEAWGKATRT